MTIEKVALLGRDKDSLTLEMLAAQLELRGIVCATTLENNMRPLTSINTQFTDVLVVYGLGEHDWWSDLLVNVHDTKVIYWSTNGTPSCGKIMDNVTMTYSLEETIEAVA